MRGTIVLRKNLESKKKIKINEGGTRSSKTYSLAQLCVLKLCNQNPNKPILITVCRKTLPSLKATAMKDFLNVLHEYNIYDDDCFNKSDLTYVMGCNEIEFISVDDPQKIRGRKRDILWMNEANEFDYDDFVQLILRTTGEVYMDYNPSDEYSWIYDNVTTRDDVEVIRSSYRDNPFINLETRKEIERLRLADKNYWRVYGLGLRGKSGLKVWTHWKLCDKLPEGGARFWGVDFGFNNAVSVTENVLKDDILYTHEHLHKSGLTDTMLVDELNILEEKGVLSKDDMMYGDNEDPKAIVTIQDAGYNIEPADKGAGSVESGIKLIKSRQWFITKESTEAIKEVKAYSWKSKDGKALDEPVKVNDHFCDSVRMAVFSFENRIVPMIW